MYSRPLDVAIRRFGYSYERRRSEDKIIDYAISMETIFSSGSKDSFTHKLRVRCARLIEDDFNERMKISENINDFYKVRSTFFYAIQLIDNGMFKRYATIIAQRMIRLIDNR
jgi:hypothetical protein